MKRRILIAAFLIMQVFCVNAQHKILTNKQWIDDLDYVVVNLKKHHPNLYYRVSEEDFNLAVENAKKKIENSKSDLEAFYALKGVVAKIQDGHTQIWDDGFLGIESVRFPFRIERFTDGIFITVIKNDYQKYLGARLLKINNIPIEEVLKMTSEITNMDNEFGRIRPSIQDITFARTLVGLGVINDEHEMKLVVESDGIQENFIINSIIDHSPVLWSNRINAAPAKGDYVNVSTLLKNKTPLHLQKQDTSVLFYWFEHLENEEAIYFQYNQVWATQPNSDETWNEFTKRIWKYIDEHAIQKLIIDVRYNDGGNGRTMIPFVNEIIKRDRFCNAENLYVLVGNRTYSASAIFITELAIHTKAVFVGSPPSSPFNFFSDMEVVGNLPNSGAGLGIASRQIDNAWSSQTTYFSPDIPAPFSSTDYFSGKDPALSAALDPKSFIDVAKIAADSSAEVAYDIYSKQIKKYKNLDWWVARYTTTLESQINSLGYELMSNHEMERAFRVFELNTLIFPKSFNVWDSLGEWYLNNEDQNNAIKYYRKSLELNPKNVNARRMIEKIQN